MIRRALFLMGAALFVAPCALLGDEAADFMSEHGCRIVEQVEATKYRPIALTVAALAALESDFGRAWWVADRRQVWAVKERRERRKGERHANLIRRFNSFEEATAFVLTMFERRKFPADRKGFFARLISSKYHATGGKYQGRVEIRERRLQKFIDLCGDKK